MTRRSKKTQRDISVHVPVLARVEGEGALHLSIRGGVIEQAQLRIYEPPRLFEKLLEGRSCFEVPDLVARICGICPVAYQMSAVNAIESLGAYAPDAWICNMRRVLYCGEWIESHCLHIHLLAAPDFYGYDSGIAMARDHPEIIQRGLHLHSLGNEIMTLFGARAVHPVSVCVGGFHHAPSVKAVADLRDMLRKALPAARELIRWTASLPLPDDQQTFTSVALRDSQHYAINAGRIVSDHGLDIAPDAFEQHFTEFQVPHSTALYSHLDGKPYLVGPLARLNINHDRLPDTLRAVLAEIGFTLPCTNMFKSIVARAVEVYFALEEVVRLLEDYRVPEFTRLPANVSAGIGYGATEAPRGLLWHRYALDAHGRVSAARIVPPTSQNQARIEEDLRCSLQRFGPDQTDSAIRFYCEKLIRNYDPCISCATHFLTLSTDRR
jgi:sulfhydrogenase subunit alpha